MSAYVSADLENCQRLEHRFKTAWSDKTPLKVSLICVTCTDANPGKTAYVAYGVDTESWGQWRARRVEREREESEVSDAGKA